MYRRVSGKHIRFSVEFKWADVRGLYWEVGSEMSEVIIGDDKFYYQGTPKQLRERYAEKMKGFVWEKYGLLLESTIYN